jgi:glyoxylase-like metal-dependent hydrolase (beta-lactamase superfamily II)
MNKFYNVTDSIYRLKVPFEAIYTSVFLIKSPSGAILVDCATTSEDVDQCIVPALVEMGYELSNIETLVLTHKHGDHAGGLERVLALAPNIEVVTSVRALCDGVCTYPMAGHTEDCIGILDMRSHTLISGDGLQGAGVDKYRCSVRKREAYLETIERIKNDGRIENILFSHAYEPWDRDSVIGRREVDACLSECIKYINGGKNESNTCK